MATPKKTVSYRPKKMVVSASPEEKSLEELYEKDFYKWTSTQSKLLRRGEYSKLDIQNLIEEIESLGRSEKRTLRSYLTNLMMHLLKIKYQPNKHTKSWDLSVRNSRIEAKRQLTENPSLKSKITKIVEEAYLSAVIAAAFETGLDEEIFPKECPWNIKDLIY